MCVKFAAASRDNGAAPRSNRWLPATAGRHSDGSRETMSTVDEINQSWGWVGLTAVEVLGENDFGSLIIRDEDDKYWRLCPQDLRCEPVADDRAAFDALSYNQQFLQGWYMTELVSLARDKLGPLANGRKYCLKVPSALGGEYGGNNLATVPLLALIRFSGEVAQQMGAIEEVNEVAFRFV
jgi:hypothetical protein